MFNCSSTMSGVNLPMTYFNVMFYRKEGSKCNLRNGFLILTPVKSSVCKLLLNASCLARIIKLPSSLSSLLLLISRNVNVEFTPISAAKELKDASPYTFFEMSNILREVLSLINSDRMWIPSLLILFPISDSSTS